MKFHHLSSYCRRLSKGPRKDNNQVNAETVAPSSEPHTVPLEHYHPVNSSVPRSADPIDYLAELKLDGEDSEIDPQPNSLFFSSLPSEIRNQIYEDFVRSSQGFCLICESRHFIICQGSPIPMTPLERSSEVLSVLLGCRRLYFEVINIIYSSATFHIPGLYNIRRFLSTTPATQHQNIRSLQLVIRLGHKFIKPDGAMSKRHRPDHPWRLYEIDWINIWRLISTLKNLARLRVTFLRYEHSDRRMFEEFPVNNPEKIGAESILGPLMSVSVQSKKPQDFTVEIHESIFKRDRAFTKFLRDVGSDVEAVQGLESAEEGRMGQVKAPFVIRKLKAPRDPRDVALGRVGDRGGMMEYGEYRMWHAPGGKYSLGLQEENVGERWGDPEGGGLGDVRSDRCRIRV